MNMTRLKELAWKLTPLTDAEHEELVTLWGLRKEYLISCLK